MSADSVDFTVYGTPAPAGSKRFVGMRGGHGVVIDANKKARPWKTHVRQVAGEAMAGRPLMRGALEVSFVFYRRRPASHFNAQGKVRSSAPIAPVTKPDVLKLARGVEDALSGIVYNDDAQIVTEHLDKRYGEPERVEVQVREIL